MSAHKQIMQAGLQFESHVVNMEIPEGRESQFCNTKIDVNGTELPLWPSGQPIEMLSRSGVFSTRFADFEILHAQLVSEAIGRANSQAANAIFAGGKKIRDKAFWKLAAAELLTQRALLFFCRCLNLRAAHTIDRWANVMQRDEYSAPHCHYFAKASINYFIDPGESDLDHRLAGQFELLDSRIIECCSKQPEYPNAALVPSMEPGKMLLFPASFLHFVHPYRGNRPRLTATWNINAGQEASQRQT